MQIETTTAAVLAYSAQAGESKLSELGVLGAAENLPGQGPERSGFQIDGTFGFCQHCGQEHGLGVHQAEAEALQKSNGGSDLKVMGQEEAIVNGEVKTGEVAASDEANEEVAVAAGGEAEGSEEAKAGEEPVERDSLTGEAELNEKEQQEVEELKR